MFEQTFKNIDGKLWKDAGCGREGLHTLQKLIDAEKSDLLDILEHVSYAIQPITREVRVTQAQTNIFAQMDSLQKEFLEFVLSRYIETGVEELAQEKLADLLVLKYQALPDAQEALGSVERIRSVFFGFQKHLYAGTMG